MSWLDIVILIAIVMSGISGLFGGLVRAGISIVGMAFGIFLAGRFYGQLAGLLAFAPENAARVLAFAIILIAVLVVAGIIAMIITKAISGTPLGIINRIGGAVLGILMGALTMGAILVIWTKFIGAPEVFSQSPLAGFLVDRFQAVLALLPADFGSVTEYFK
jgi:membrane protein required for colicin V production